MHRVTSLALLLLSLPALAQEEAPAAPPPEPKKLAVVPLALLSGGIPIEKSRKATSMFTTEFRNSDAFQLVDVKRLPADPAAEALATARLKVDEAKDLRAKRKFRLADEALQKAIEAYKAGITALPDFRADAAFPTGIGEVADAYALLAAVQYNTGRDDEGGKTLLTALALAPDRDLPLAATSPLFASLTADLRKQLKAAPKGSVLFESTPAYAALWVDGQKVDGATPLQLVEVPFGLHYYKAQMANGELLGGTVTVVPAGQAKVTLAPQAKDADTRLLTAIAQNKLNEEALAALKDFAKQSSAELVIFGTVFSDPGRNLVMDSFIFSAVANEIRRLRRSKFDFELLDAGNEFLSLSRDVAAQGLAAGEAVKVPATVAANLPALKVAQWKFGQSSTKLADDEPEAKAPDRAAGQPEQPKGPRGPLRRKN